MLKQMTEGMRESLLFAFAKNNVNDKVASKIQEYLGNRWRVRF